MDPGTRAALVAALAFQVELGADECIGETPVDRFAEARAERARADGRAAPAPGRPAAGEPAAPAAPASARGDRAPAAGPVGGARDPSPDAPPSRHGGGASVRGEPPAAASAREIAAACATLPELAAALAAFDGCPELKGGARACVFADGNPAARVMVIGEAPGRDEDLAGKPFVGRSGQLLDRMLAAIGLDRAAADPAAAAYIANVLPWRPVDNRAPSGDEATILAPFLIRHVELAAPDFLLLAGGAPARLFLGPETGILKARGRWRRVLDRPAMPTLHPAYLLRTPAAKRLAWRDLLALRCALDGEPVRFD